MILFVLAYFAGVVTVASPCILPVLPFVFARAHRSFLRSDLPLLMGMAATFAAVASLAAVAGGWAVTVNQFGRIAAIGLLGLFGITLLFPSLSDRATRPLVALGERLSRSAQPTAPSDRPAIGELGSSFLLGVATGLLWTPCAGPVLGLILTTAALQGASAHTALLLFVYALGSATSLALALLIGGRVFAAMKRSLGASEWIRRGLGAAVLAGVAVIALGLDTGFLTRISPAGTNALEQSLLDRFHARVASSRAPSTSSGPPTRGGAEPVKGPAAASSGVAKNANATSAAAAVTTPIDPFADLPPFQPHPTLDQELQNLPIEGEMSSIAGAVAWLNSPPLTAAGLRGKVVLVDFWTYSCINCLRTIPYLRAWAQKYQRHGLVVLAVHTPEFAFEKNLDNVKHAVARLDIPYPVAVDSNYAIWRAFNNSAWPGDYFIDAEGRIRAEHSGDGQYAIAERVIQHLLMQAGYTGVPGGLVAVSTSGAEAAEDFNDMDSAETYIGYQQADQFISPGGQVKDAPHSYTMGMPQFGQWGLSGNWTVGPQRAVLNDKGGSIAMRFHARDLHMVLGSAPGGAPVRFRVTIDGLPPGDSHGSDTNAAGEGVITKPRLYQLIRQDGKITDHTFKIWFQDAGVQAYSFTFG